MLGLEFTRQIVFNGLVSGLAVGVLAMGVVLIYRASGVINFAVGALGVLSASLLAVLTINYGWPFWPAAIVSLAAGAALAAAVELTVITRLFTAPRVVVLVATIGIAQLGELLRLALPTLEGGFTVRYPLAISGQWELAGVRISGAALSVVIVAPVAAAALSWFITRTVYGRAIRAAAANADLARLFGISPKLVSTLTWTIAGVLAAVALILLAGLNVSAAALSTLGSATLVQVLAAALIGRLRSFPLALAGGVAIGIARTVLTFSYPASAGLFDAVLFIAIVIATWLAVSSQTDEDDSFAFVPTEPPDPRGAGQSVVGSRIGSPAGDLGSCRRRVPAAGGSGIVAAVPLRPSGGDRGHRHVDGGADGVGRPDLTRPGGIGGRGRAHHGSTGQRPRSGRRRRRRVVCGAGARTTPVPGRGAHRPRSSRAWSR